MANDKLHLAMLAGARAIENNKRLCGTTYCYDVFGRFGGPKEISYSEAARILREAGASPQREEGQDA